MSRDLDARVAEAMGLEVIGEAWADPDPSACTEWFVCEGEAHSLHPVYVYDCSCAWWEDDPEVPTERALGHYVHCLRVVPFYSTDFAAARHMEEWMQTEKPELRSAYGAALYNIVSPKGFFFWESVAWSIATATPEQRCRAFLKAMEAQPSATPNTGDGSPDSAPISS